MLRNKLSALVRDQRGLSTVEYTVLLVLIVACSVGLWKKFGEDVQDRLSDAKGEFTKQVKVKSSAAGGKGGGG